MKTVLRIILPLLIVFGAYSYAKYLIDNKEEPPKRKPPEVRTHVQAIRLEPQDFPVIVRSQGTVRPRTESTLVSQVAGEITEISKNLREGGFFEANDALLQIDRVDYETAVIMAQASIARAEVTLAEEDARAQQALTEWKKLGGEGEPSPLVLRVPQKKEAEASLRSAKAQLEQAKRDLQRTEITAPYAGRVLQKMADIGQVVSRGAVLARIYAIDYAEIDLPIKGQDLHFLQLPEVYRGEKTPAGQNLEVTLTTTAGNRSYQYAGKVVRSSGAVDQRSRQLSLVAQVTDPYARTAEGRPPLKVGMFATAEIKGAVLKNKIVIPRIALREGRDVLLIDAQNKLVRTPVDVLWGGPEQVVIANGLQPGALLCITPVTYAVTGAPVVPDIEGEGVRDLNPSKPRKPLAKSGKKPTASQHNDSAESHPEAKAEQQ